MNDYRTNQKGPDPVETITIELRGLQNKVDRHIGLWLITTTFLSAAYVFVVYRDVVTSFEQRASDSGLEEDPAQRQETRLQDRDLCDRACAHLQPEAVSAVCEWNTRELRTCTCTCGLNNYNELVAVDVEEPR